MSTAVQALPREERVSLGRRLPLWVFRVAALLAGISVFFPPANPGRISEKINASASLFTTGVSYGTITNSMGRILRSQWIQDADIKLLMIACVAVMAGVILCGAGGCMSLGNRKMRRVGLALPLIGAPVMGAGLLLIRRTYDRMLAHGEEVGKLDKIGIMVPDGFWVFCAFAGLLFLTALIAFLSTGKETDPAAKMEMEEKYRLFLMMLPVILLSLVFAYLPIWGWRFAFFDYTPGGSIGADNYVGFKWFSFLFSDPATTKDLLRVLRNTLVMSGLGIATSWLPIAFAILLAEMRSTKFQRFVQTFTTIPNFISWVLVYAIAICIFSTDGFVNSFLTNVMHVSGAKTNYLQIADHTWLKMLLWGTWKGVGWSAIIYIAGIAGIDQQLYEAAKVDGANRFRCIWHITIPGLIPTYMVMLLMSIAGILSNGMEQYLVFSNAMNKDVIEVLDLYVYNIGIGQNRISLSTVVGISKSLIGITLLFAANGISKTIRGESII
ncbi:MAG: sugar ABC transporter permease [Clostridia bacterium]|nr:sugar ABC transporter permease [Clostridia bacterium]